MTEKENLKTLSGSELFDFYLSKGDEYSGVVFDAFVRIREDLFPLLEEAVRSGKKIILTCDLSTGVFDPPITVTVG